MPSNKPSLVFFYTYVLQSLRDREYYIGWSTNLRERVQEHNAGENLSTAPRRPFRPIYYEACLNREDAKQRERYFKTTAGRRFLAKRLKHWRTSNLRRLQ